MESGERKIPSTRPFRGDALTRGASIPLMSWRGCPGHGPWPRLEVPMTYQPGFSRVLHLLPQRLPSWISSHVTCQRNTGSAHQELAPKAGPPKRVKGPAC